MRKEKRTPSHRYTSCTGSIAAFANRVSVNSKCVSSVSSSSCIRVEGGGKEDFQWVSSHVRERSIDLRSQKQATHAFLFQEQQDIYRILEFRDLIF